MSPNAPSREEALRGLLELLAMEHEALIHMDAREMDAISKKKELLTAALATAADPPTFAEKELAGDVREAAVKNHVLLSHARDCIRAALGSLDPRTGPCAAPPPLRVDVRG